MFENLIAQASAVSALRGDIARGTLPGALLFHGPPYSGKLTAALETARVLNCESAAEWGCACASCAQHRTLVHPYVLLMGSRQFMEEIGASVDVLSRDNRPAARYLVVRAVRKLLRRFDPVLWEGQENKVSAAMTTVGEVNELLEALLPGAELPPRRTLSGALKELLELCASLQKALHPGQAGRQTQTQSDNIPIHQVRRASVWAHSTSPGSRKVAILENADRMVEGSRNALLKILEEPPADTYFILTTTSRERILPTVRSRLRPYAFVERGEEAVREILDRIFRDASGSFRSLEEYFLAWVVGPDQLRNDARAFLDAAVGIRNPDFLDATGFLSQYLSDARVFRAFLLQLSRTLNERLRAAVCGGADHESIAALRRWSALITERERLHDGLRLNPQLLADSLFYELRES